ncbi:MAG: sigma-70 family RNA polymerase sigma factor [Eubacteriales bacterium]|nr:sigma-70 family RNA polymerase sigma factor [Eubacteriales bacterium]
MKHKSEDLYEQHAQQVYRYLYVLTGDSDTAEELTQETFYQAIKSLHTFRGDCTPQVWLCAIAKRLWYKELQRRKRTVPLEDTHIAGLTAADNPEAEAQQREERMNLYRALQKLTPETRDVIHLRLTAGFSFREIGDIMGHTETWARVRFYRGKEQLTKIMGGDQNETE